MQALRFGNVAYIGSTFEAGKYVQHIARNLLKQTGKTVKDIPDPADPVAIAFHNGGRSEHASDYFLVDGDDARFVRAVYAIQHAKSQSEPPEPVYKEGQEDYYVQIRDWYRAWQDVRNMLTTYVYTKAGRPLTGKEIPSCAAEVGSKWEMLYSGHDYEATVCDKRLNM